MRKGLRVLGFMVIVMEALTASVGFAQQAQQDYYGAIATSKSGTWGYAYDYPSRDQAEQRALKECGKADCQIQLWFKNACGAIAKDEQGNLGWAWAETREQAEASSLSGCGTGKCKVQVWTCTTRY